MFLRLQRTFKHRLVGGLPSRGSNERSNSEITGVIWKTKWENVKGQKWTTTRFTFVHNKLEFEWNSPILPHWCPSIPNRPALLIIWCLLSQIWTLLHSKPTYFSELPGPATGGHLRLVFTQSWCSTWARMEVLCAFPRLSSRQYESCSSYHTAFNKWKFVAVEPETCLQIWSEYKYWRWNESRWCSNASASEYHSTQRPLLHCLHDFMPFLQHVPQRRRKGWLIVLRANPPNVNNTTKRCMKGMKTGCGIRQTAVCVAWARRSRLVMLWLLHDHDGAFVEEEILVVVWHQLFLLKQLISLLTFFFFSPCWGGCSEKNRKTSLNCAHRRARQSRCHVGLITVTLNSSLQAGACRAVSGVMAVFVKWRQIFLHLSCTLVKCSAGYLKTKNLCNIVRINVCILNDKKRPAVMPRIFAHICQCDDAEKSLQNYIWTIPCCGTLEQSHEHPTAVGSFRMFTQPIKGHATLWHPFKKKKKDR